DGDVYAGEFRFGRREGKGTYTYAKGESYMGDWLADRMHGRGVYKYSSGKVYDGMWEEDRPHGAGQLTDGNVVTPNDPTNPTPEARERSRTC
ncbi:hypothetical protein T484DRAFT_1636502, partial [Baffinella frigidus]